MTALLFEVVVSLKFYKGKQKIVFLVDDEIVERDWRSVLGGTNWGAHRFYVIPFKSSKYLLWRREIEINELTVKTNRR